MNLHKYKLRIEYAQIEERLKCNFWTDEIKQNKLNRLKEINRCLTLI